MYVKSLRIAGFKSFADPTVLGFESAVNVIVGPNGSGKSNVADALQWVLGSQAPSNLRGASMEDVIFAGSESRARVGTAEVELVLDNADRVLPLDLNEVTISRFTDRAGTSEYRINGAACRLLDIAELLSDTGIGRSIHTVVGQGQLDAVLQARPEERRVFIEEAAQVGKFRRRKDRALKKIERVDDNLTRINDVLLELRRSIRPLKRQANQASAYSELVAERNSLRQRLAATEVARLAADDGGYDLEEETRRAGLLSEELAGIRARLEGAAAERAELFELADAQRRRADRMGRSVDRLTSLGRLATERAEKISARLAAETEEGYRERIRLLEADLRRWSVEKASLGEAAAVARGTAQAAADRAAVRAEQLEASERDLNRARSEETEAAQALVRAEGSEAAGRATLGSIRSRVRAVEERRDVATAELEQETRALAAAEEEVRTIEAELDAKTEAAAGAEARLEAVRSRAEELKEKVGLSHSVRAAAVARLEALEEVAELLAAETHIASRLAPLIEAARENAALASSSEAEARRILATADAEVESAWKVVAAHDEELRRLDALQSGSAERLSGRRRKREKREIELAALNEEMSRAQESLASAERSAAEERAALPARTAALQEARSVREGAEAKVSSLRSEHSGAAESAKETEMEARSAEEKALAAGLRCEEAESGIADAEKALAGLEDLRARLGRSRAAAERVARAAAAAAERGAAWVQRADANAVTARAEAEECDRKLSSLRGRERELADSLEEHGRKRNEAEIRRAQNDARIEAIGERAMEEWGFTPADLERIDVLSEDEEQAAGERVELLDRDMKRLGPVNPRAAQEYSEAAEREEFLVSQIEDLKTSRNDLLRVVTEVDDTIREVFKTAFDDVAREFEGVFDRLFPGGTGRLKLTDPDDLLASGIEIEARPPGKNVRKLSLLSGGERSLVALAFLFAIFRSHPSPFYLLDEVEAALDDVNLQRFLTLIAELEKRAQVLIITHQKRTMEAADVLYGVSMSRAGVSRVVAKKMEDHDGPSEPAFT